MPPKRLGFYMYAPRIGGAERYLKDLIAAVDRDQWTVVLLYLPWPQFDRYFEVGSQLFEARPVGVRELGARRGGRGDAGPPGTGSEISATWLRTLVANTKRLRHLTPAAQAVSRAAYFAINRRLLRSALRESRLDVLHVVNGGYPGATSAQAALAAGLDIGIPMRVMTVCSTALARSSPIAADAAIDRAVQAAAHAIVVPGEIPARALVERRGFDPGLIHRIPWGVRPPPSGLDKVEARRRLRISPNQFVAGSLANFTPTKGQELLVQAAARLRDRYPRLRWLLGGDGPMRTSVINLARQLGVHDIVTFPGSIDDPFLFAASLDVFVLASDIEGLPYVVLEAMSQGIPVLATEVGAMNDAVINGVTGLLIPPRDVDAIERAMVTMASDDEARKDMGEAAGRVFEQTFHIERMLEAHARLWSSSGRV